VHLHCDLSQRSPAWHLIAPHLHSPLTQLSDPRSAAHAGPLPHWQIPLKQRLAKLGSQLAHRFPAVPHPVKVAGAMQATPEQHPVQAPQSGAPGGPRKRSVCTSSPFFIVTSPRSAAITSPWESPSTDTVTSCPPRLSGKRIRTRCPDCSGCGGASNRAGRSTGTNSIGEDADLAENRSWVMLRFLSSNVTCTKSEVPSPLPRQLPTLTDKPTAAASPKAARTFDERVWKSIIGR